MRAGIVGASIALAAVLYFLPKGSGVGNNAKPKQEPVETAGAFSEEGFKKKSKSLLPFDLIAKADSLEGLLNDSPKDTTVLDTLVSFWDSANSPGISASYSKQKATQTGLEQDWINAAYRYFDATKAATPQHRTSRDATGNPGFPMDYDPTPAHCLPPPGARARTHCGPHMLRTRNTFALLANTTDQELTPAPNTIQA